MHYLLDMMTQVHELPSNRESVGHDQGIIDGNIIPNAALEHGAPARSQSPEAGGEVVGVGRLTWGQIHIDICTLTERCRSTDCSCVGDDIVCQLERAESTGTIVLCQLGKGLFAAAQSDNSIGSHGQSGQDCTAAKVTCRWCNNDRLPCL